MTSSARGSRQRDRPRRAFLEQQLRGTNDRVGMEPSLGRPVVDDVAQRHQRHALVVCHVGANDGERSPVGTLVGV
jgi:hypothetical protein